MFRVLLASTYFQRMFSHTEEQENKRYSTKNGLNCVNPFKGELCRDCCLNQKSSPFQDDH